MKTWQLLRQNPHLWSRCQLRQQIVTAIREFFGRRKFTEIETPLLATKLPAESYIEVFETELLNRQRHATRAFLTTSPEPFLKKLLVAGVGNCFTITKSFRNTEDLSNTHNPEFTLLEWYEVNKDYKDVMKTTEELFCFIYNFLYASSEESAASRRLMQEVNNKTIKQYNNKYKLIYQGRSIDLTPPWERLSMTQAFTKYAKVNLEKALTREAMAAVAHKKGYQVGKNNTWEELFHQIYLNEVEPHLGKGRPTIIYDFPAQTAALAKKKGSDPRFAERFEVYIGGLELGDCYSELTDWKEQEERFKQEIQERKRLGKIAYPYDDDLIEALKVGLPRCSGLALGVDRLIMLFADVSTIQKVLFFPASEMRED